MQVLVCACVCVRSHVRASERWIHMHAEQQPLLSTATSVNRTDITYSFNHCPRAVHKTHRRFMSFWKRVFGGALITKRRWHGACILCSWTYSTRYIVQYVCCGNRLRRILFNYISREKIAYLPCVLPINGFSSVHIGRKIGKKNQWHRPLLFFFSTATSAI